jgi:hypothetical protein
VVQNTLRLCFSALFLSLGFAAAAQGKRSNLTLLQKWKLAWVRSSQHLRHRDMLKRRSHNEDAEYFETISPKD